MSQTAQPRTYERIHLTINGVDRPVVCDPAKDTLSTVIRRDLARRRLRYHMDRAEDTVLYFD